MELVTLKVTPETRQMLKEAAVLQQVTMTGLTEVLARAELMRVRREQRKDKK